MIDPRIPMMGQSPDMIEAVNSGFADGGNFAKLLIGSQVNRMRDLDGYGQQKAFADNNFFGRQLRGQLKQDQAAALQTQIAQQKAFADIDKTQSEAYKNNQQGGGYALDNSGKTQAAIESVIQQAAMTGDPMQVRLGLHRLQKTGLITPEQYQQETAIVQAMTPGELQKYAQGSALTNKEVAPYLYQTKDNFATNAQSDLNNQRTTNASIYSTDVGASTADKNRAQQQSQFDANLYVQQNKPLDYFTAADGTRYAVYANGQGIPVSNAQGAPIKAQPSGNQNGKPILSDKAMASVGEMKTQLAKSNQSASKINGLIASIKNKELDLSAASQIGAKARGLFGFSNENSLGVDKFNTAFNEAANDILQQAKGTQTEGDAQRAIQVLRNNPPRDNAAALQALEQLAAIQEVIINTTTSNINDIYDNYGAVRPQQNAGRDTFNLFD